MAYDKRYLKRVGKFSGVQIARNQGRRAAEDMKGHNHYPVGSLRYQAWQQAYDETVDQINRDFANDWNRNDYA